MVEGVKVLHLSSPEHRASRLADERLTIGAWNLPGDGKYQILHRGRILDDLVGVIRLRHDLN